MALLGHRQRREGHCKFYEELTEELSQLVRSAVLTPSFEAEPSDAAHHVWEWFIDLTQGRGNGISGPLPLSWLEMKAWATTTHAAVAPAEWRMLRQMDLAYIAACKEWSERDQQSAQAPHIYSEQPMTPALFDAIF